jgi:hypothetical protein
MLKQTKRISILSLFFFISCSSKDHKMCDCLEAGEKLNKFSSQIMLKEISSKNMRTMKMLKSDKNQKCKLYQKMSGKEMFELKEKCKDN